MLGNAISTNSLRKKSWGTHCAQSIRPICSTLSAWPRLLFECGPWEQQGKMHSDFTRTGCLSDWNAEVVYVLSIWKMQQAHQMYPNVSSHQTQIRKPPRQFLQAFLHEMLTVRDLVGACGEGPPGMMDDDVGWCWMMFMMKDVDEGYWCWPCFPFSLFIHKFILSTVASCDSLKDGVLTLAWFFFARPYGFCCAEKRYL